MPEQEESEQNVGAGPFKQGFGQCFEGPDVRATSLLESQLQVLHIQAHIHLYHSVMYIVQHRPQVGLVDRPIIDPRDYLASIFCNPLRVRNNPEPPVSLLISVQDGKLHIDAGQLDPALHIELEHIQPVPGAGHQLDLVLDGPAAQLVRSVLPESAHQLNTRGVAHLQHCLVRVGLHE